MPLLPVALYGLEVPPGELVVPAVPDFPATFRITMAAIDPTAEVSEEFAGSVPRATLKLIRVDNGGDEEDSDEDEEDEEFMRKLLAESGSSDEDEEDEDEEPNGGPSNPAKSQKAKKAAAVAQLISALENDEESDEDMADAPNGINGKASKKGKAKATDVVDDDEDEDEDSEDDEEDGFPEEFVICTLDPEKNYQQTLDITIGEDELVYFKVVGTHSIHLTGNYVVPDDNGHNHHHEVYDSDEDEDYDLSPDEDELDLELEEDESDDLDNLEDPRITEVESEEESLKTVAKSDKKGKNKRAAEEEIETLDDMIEKTEEPKLSKKQLKKLKNNKGEAVASKSEEKEKPASKTDKKVQFAKNLEQGPTGSTPEAKTETKKKESNVRVVQGVKIDDRVIGKGRQAKKGNKVGMRYIGKLQDGKVFDANKSGQPFRFKLGSGEVIQGWDIGIAGIAVGGERRLVIPANLAYGSKSQPGIPANSTLTFDVKCLEIN